MAMSTIYSNHPAKDALHIDKYDSNQADEEFNFNSFLDTFAYLASQDMTMKSIRERSRALGEQLFTSLAK